MATDRNASAENCAAPERGTVRRTVTVADQANAARRALQRAMAKVRITHGQRRTIVNNITISGIVGPDEIAKRIVQNALSRSPHRAYPHYWSTYCIHELHDECRLTCKTCQAPCLCPCHTKGSTT